MEKNMIHSYKNLIQNNWSFLLLPHNIYNFIINSFALSEKKLKKKLVLGIIVILVILSTSTFRIQPIFASNYTYQFTNPAISSLVPRDPMLITHNDNFTDYGFPGMGTL